MIRAPKQYLSLWLLLAAFFTNSSIVKAQVLRYTGPMQFGAYHGEADYGFIMTAGDTVLEGPFSFTKSSLEALLNDQDYSFHVSGVFDEGEAHGLWNFQFGEFKTTGSADVVDYEYRVPLNGVQQEAQGLMYEGKPDSLWNFSVKQIRESELDTTLFHIRVMYDKGIPQRSFRFQDHSHILVGRFLRNGLAHDEWSLFARDDIENGESWWFHNGSLSKMELRRDGEVIEVPLEASSLDNLATIDLDLGYIKALRILQTNEELFPLSQARMPELLSESLAFYEKIDHFLSQFGRSEFKSGFKVKLATYPLVDEEMKQLESIDRYLEKARPMSAAILNSAQLNILKLSDRDVLYLYNVTEAISKDFLDPLDQLAQCNHDSILDFIPRKRIEHWLWSNGKPKRKLTVDVALDSMVQQRNFVFRDADRFDFNATEFRGEADMAEYALYVLDSITNIFSDKISKEEIEEELLVLEEKLIEKGKALHRVVDSLSSKESASNKNLLLRIKDVVDENLSAYAASPEDSDKLEQAGGAIQCMDQLMRLGDIIGQLPSRQEEIQELYTDALWNPFTATVMDEQVKRRITSAYHKILIPYYLEQATSKLNCENVEDMIFLFENTHQRMSEMREEDTSKMERKLRKEDDPIRIMQLFSIGPNQKKQIGNG